MTRLIAALCAVLVISSLHAHHGSDSASGSPALSSVRSGEVLEAADIRLSYGLGYTAYPLLTDQELQGRVQDRGGKAMDVVRDYTLAQTLDLSAGLTSFLQASLAATYVRHENVREGHLHGNGSYGLHSFGSIQGLAGTELRLKARVGHGGWGRAALELSGRLPGDDSWPSDSITVDGTANTATGKFSTRAKPAALNQGLQPGLGGTGVCAALAWTGESGPWRADASLAAVLASTYKGYNAGDRRSLGLDLARGFGGEEGSRLSHWLAIEASVEQAERTSANGVVSDESGGWLAWLGLRLRSQLNERVGVSLGASAPVWAQLGAGVLAPSFGAGLGMELKL